METCKFIQIGCPMMTPSSVKSISVKIKSSNKWKKAIIYDTVEEKVIDEINNKNDNTFYHISEKYDKTTGNFFLTINDSPITLPTNQMYLYRYMIKLITKEINKKNIIKKHTPIDYIKTYNQFIPIYTSFV
jgi:hypothetical protein